MVLGNPSIAPVFGVTILETADRCAEVLKAPSADPALTLVDEADPLQIVVNGGRRWMLVLGNVLFHPGVAPIRCHQDRCVAEVLKRDEAVSFVEELDLPAPLPTLEVFDVGRRVDPGLSAVPSAKYDGIYLAVATQPRRGVGLRVNLAALVDQSADNEPVVLISEVNVDQIRSVLPHVNQFPARAVVRRLDDGRTREPGIVRPGPIGDAFVDRVEAADARG